MSVSVTEPRTAVPIFPAAQPATPAAADMPAEDPRVTLIRTAGDDATQIAKSLIDRLKAGERQASDSARALKIALAKARLNALRLAAMAAAAARDGKRAVGIAKDVADAVRAVQAAADSQGDAPEIAAAPADGDAAAAPGATAGTPDTSADTASAPAGIAAANIPAPATTDPAATPGAAVIAGPGADNPDIDGVLASARAILAILRRATMPGSEEERWISGVLAGVGTGIAAPAAPSHIDLSA